MFSKGLNMDTFSGCGGGENFACPSIRKKGRSLSQTSFLFASNFIHIPQSFERIDQKKTLAFAPSYKWSRSQSSNDDYSEQASVNYESSQSNFYLTSTAPSKSNQNLLFINENDTQPTRVFQQPDESCTDLSSNYKYNPIFPENQLYAHHMKGKTSSPASYTSVKHHILENIPINLISNLNILLNKNNKCETLISSKTSFCRINNVLSNNQTSSTASRIYADVKNDRNSQPKLESLKCFPSLNKTQHEFNYLSDVSNHSSKCQPNDLVVLKPASLSMSTSCSSESVISDLHIEPKPSSETTLESESIHDAEDDMHVHYINNSASAESEYSLLISKGYTFTNKLRSKRDLIRLNNLMEENGDTSSVTTRAASNITTETELHVVNFSQYNVDPLGAVNRHQNEDSSNSKDRNSYLSQSGANIELDIFETCHSELKSSVASNHLFTHSIQSKSVNSLRQYVAGSAKSDKTIKSESGRLRPKIDEQNWKKPLKIIPNYEHSFSKNEMDMVGEDSSPGKLVMKDSLCRQNGSLRNTVKKVSKRFMKRKSFHTSDKDSSSELYSENSEGSNSYKSDKLYCNYEYPWENNFAEYESSVVWEPKQKGFQRGKYMWKASDYNSGPSRVPQFRSKPKTEIIRNCVKNAQMAMQLKKIRKLKNHPVSSKSTLIAGQRYSRCTVTSDSMYSNAHKAHFLSKRGKLKRTTVKGSRKKASEKKMSLNEINKQSSIRRKRSLSKGKFKKQRESAESSKEFCNSNDTEEIERSYKKKESSKMSNTQERLSVNDMKKVNCVNSKQEILNFIDAKEIVNLNKRKEPRNSDDEKIITSHGDGKEVHRPYEKVMDCVRDKHYDKAFVGNKKKNNIKLEMDVYSRSDKKKEADTNEKRRFHKNIFNKKEGKENECSMNQKNDVSYKAISRIEDLFSLVEGHHTHSEHERKESFHSCEKKNILSINENETKLGNNTIDSDFLNNWKIHQSNNSLSSELASSYYLYTEQKSTVDNSESDLSISKSTSEYINWAKNCLFNRKSETYGSYNFQDMHDKLDWPCMKSVLEAGDSSNYENAYSSVRKNFSDIGDGCVEVTSTSDSQTSAKTSDDSVCTVGSKSALSMIPEEKDGSVEKLKSPFLSQKNSSVSNVPNHNICNFVQQEKIPIVVYNKNNSCSRGSLTSKEESLHSSRSSKSKRKSQRLMVSSESEGEYSKFKEEMKYYCKIIRPQNPPQIIPSSSTFSPDKSATQI